ncbi:MAG: hypothetical protein K1X75_08815 [Leptospirales bacterium]|nr:hypothetical protein [Leptospirales bacterium]
MKQLRKALGDVLVQSLNTQQMSHLGREVDGDFSIEEISGFGDKIVIPRKVAADCVLQHFGSPDKLMQYIAFMLSREGQGASGGVIHVKGADRLVALLQEDGWIFDRQNARFVRDQRVEQSSGWGFMRDGEEYPFCLASIDVVASSELVRTNVKEDVEATMSAMAASIQRQVENWDGRVWYWHGDGGMAAFHGESSAPMTVLALVTILNYLPLFNIVESQLRPENDLKLRIGVHYGPCVYRNDVRLIASDDLKLAQEVEKKYSAANCLAVTSPVHRLLPDEIRRHFREGEELRGMRVYQYQPT